jgi:hypothetical protein
LYDTFFESIVFDDITTLKSPFLAQLACSSETDRKIRINIYYSSSLTGGKDVIIAATTFGFREMLRSGKGTFISDMISEHCSNTKATLTVATTPVNPFNDSFFTLSSSVDKNPLTQQYVFFRGEESVPTVICDEVTYEPLFPVEVPVAFLRNFSTGLQKSILAWEDRCKLERIRQGKFVSIAEAHRYGWHQLRITVLASRIKVQGDAFQKATAALLSASTATSASASASAGNGYANANANGNGNDEHGDGDADLLAMPPPPAPALLPPMSPAAPRQISVNNSSTSSRTSSVIEESRAKAACNTNVDVLLDRYVDIYSYR